MQTEQDIPTDVFHDLGDGEQTILADEVSATAIDPKIRNQRMNGIISHDLLVEAEVMVIGVGAIGRQVALQLATMGVGNITIVDHDTVSVENLGVQGFGETELGLTKVSAVRRRIETDNSGVIVNVFASKFMKSIDHPPVIFCCVDTMEARKSIFDIVQPNVGLFVDGRMNARLMQIITHAHTFDPEQYLDTIFPDAEAQDGSCTAKTTIYTASIAAGLMVNQFVNWLTLDPAFVQPRVTLNLLSMEMSHESASNAEEKRRQVQGVGSGEPGTGEGDDRTSTRQEVQAEPQQGSASETGHDRPEIRGEEEDFDEGEELDDDDLDDAFNDEDEDEEEEDDEYAEV